MNVGGSPGYLTDVEWNEALVSMGFSNHMVTDGRARALGLTRALEARNGALATLAAQLPPALLAEQLGLSLSGASNWSKATGAARGEYAALHR